MQRKILKTKQDIKKQNNTCLKIFQIIISEQLTLNTSLTSILFSKKNFFSTLNKNFHYYK